MAKQKTCERQASFSRGSPRVPSTPSSRWMSPRTSVPGWLQFLGILVKAAGCPASRCEVALGTHCPHDRSVGPLPGMGGPQQHAVARQWEVPVRDSPVGEEPCGTAGREAQGAPHIRGLSLFLTFGGILQGSDTVRGPSPAQARAHGCGAVEAAQRPPETRAWITEGSVGLEANPLDGQEDSEDLLPSRLLTAMCPWVSLWVSLGFHFSTETQRLNPIPYIQGALPVSQ